MGKKGKKKGGAEEAPAGGGGGGDKPKPQQQGKKKGGAEGAPAGGGGGGDKPKPQQQGVDQGGRAHHQGGGDGKAAGQGGAGQVRGAAPGGATGQGRGAAPGVGTGQGRGADPGGGTGQGGGGTPGEGPGQGRGGTGRGRGIAPGGGMPVGVQPGAWARPQTAQGQQPRPQTAQGQQGQQPRLHTAQGQQGQPRPQIAPQSQVPASRSASQSEYSRSSSSSSVATSSGQRVGEITRSTKEMSLASLSLPLRDKPGSLGRKIIVESNHFALDFKNFNIKIYHYDVSITPDRPFRLYRKVVEKFRQEYYPTNYFGFDGKKNIFTNIEMDAETVADLTIHDQEKSLDHPGIEYNIVVKFANHFNLGKLAEYFRSGSSLQPPQLMIQALDVALRHPAFENPMFIPVGRSIFSPPKGQIVSLGGGLNLWYGFYQSAILGWKPLLNVDVAHKGFPESVNCVQALMNITNVDGKTELDRFAFTNFNNYIKGLKVTYEIPNVKNSKRTYKITGLADSPNKKKFIDDKDGKKEITIADYFSKKKNHRLKYPHLPSLQAGAKTDKRDCCLPMELCTIVEGQAVNRKLDEKQTAEMVKNAARPTWERKKRIMDSVQQMRYNQDKCVAQFGITVNSQFEQIEARVMPPPKLEYGQGKISVSKGVWRPGKFISTNHIDSWAIVNLDFRTDDRALKNIADCFAQFSREVGMNVSQPQIRSIKTKRDEDIRPQLKNVFNELQSAKLIVVVIPTFGDSYGKVKQVAELYCGVLTQCLKAKTVQRLNGSTVVNILLKVNAKLNGVNHSLVMEERFNFLRRPTIIFGADVTHPSPDQTDIPSVAAVTASFDVNAFRYNVEWLVQDARLEIIQDLTAIVKSHLMHFYRSNNKTKPEQIIFYRDGVSEGQFKQVLDEEVQAIRRACKSLQQDYEPPITFLVVQKRHHTRLFPVNERDSEDRNKNVPAGTVVDTIITHPTEKDFYLNSHASIQGTSRPTKYHVLWDDANRSMDTLQVITYYLCHMFTRCARAISYPAPTYYAHLAAFRIRSYCEGKSMSLWSFQKDPKLKEVQKKVSSNHPMFFV